MALTQFNQWEPTLDPVNGVMAQEPRVFSHDAVGVVVGAINNSDANHGITVTNPGNGIGKYAVGDTITLSNPTSVVVALLASITTPFTAATDGIYLCTATGGATVDNVVTTGSGTGLTFNLTVSGGVTTQIDILTAGSGYAIGDTITMNSARFGGAVNEVITLDADNFLEAVLRVDAIDADGKVTNYEVTTPGAGYSLGQSLTSTSSGSGVGFTCDVANIDIPNTQKRGCCLYIGASTGLTSLTVVMESGNTATFKTISAGTILPILVKRITSTLTTNDVLALY
jgi:hypothetical protein